LRYGASAYQYFFTLADFSSVVLQFVAVFPYTVTQSTNNDVLVYPAEIAITHYTLGSGVSSSFSKLINFHPKLFYGTGVPAWDQDNVEKRATSLDVSLKEPQGVSPNEMWRQFMERRRHYSITVCDENDIWLVDSALYFLASTAGEDQLPVHKRCNTSIGAGLELMAGIVTALASHHTRVSKEPVQEALSVEKIKQEFEVVAMSIPLVRFLLLHMVNAL
ncbi:hypothetical protein COOONC_16787, partial [Cooperia oncophora]